MNGIAVTDENGNKLGNSKVRHLRFYSESGVLVVPFDKTTVCSFLKNADFKAALTSSTESCSKRHYTGDHLKDHHGSTRNEYVKDLLEDISAHHFILFLS